MGFIRVLGKLLISVGCGVLMFVGWTLWGTGLYTNQQQDQLREEFEESLEQARESEGPSKAFLRSVGPGDLAFELRIPTIGFNKIVVEGVGSEDLRKGPGHYPQCRAGFEKPLCTPFPAAWPGEPGRVIVSGHRTTYGAPFYRLNEVSKGDEIRVRAQWGNFTYVVTRKEVVDPSTATIVVQELNKSELVLTTCNPRFSAAQRLIVYARMVEER
jgi:sortase A